MSLQDFKTIAWWSVTPEFWIAFIIITMIVIINNNNIIVMIEQNIFRKGLHTLSDDKQNLNFSTCFASSQLQQTDKRRKKQTNKQKKLNQNGLLWIVNSPCIDFPKLLVHHSSIIVTLLFMTLSKGETLVKYLHCILLYNVSNVSALTNGLPCTVSLKLCLVKKTQI